MYLDRYRALVLLGEPGIGHARGRSHADKRHGVGAVDRFQKTSSAATVPPISKVGRAPPGRHFFMTASRKGRTPNGG
jgi:hypothetical protein